MRGFVVDLTDGLAEAGCLGLVPDTRFIHQGLAVNRGAAEANALLHRYRARSMDDDDVGAMRGARVRACMYWRLGRARCSPTSASGAKRQGQYRAGPHGVLQHCVSS